jgi:O-antigen/teichoic acid export membrane protein
MRALTAILTRARGNVAFALLDQGWVSAVNFLTVVVLARYLPLRDFGVFMIAQTLLQLCTGLQNALVTQPHNILGAQRDGRDYVRLTFVLGILQLMLAVALALCAALIGAALLGAGQVAFAQVALAMASIMLPTMGREFVRRVLYTQGDAVAATLNDFVSYAVQLLTVAAVAWNVGGVAATPANALLATGAAAFAATSFGCWQLRAALRPSQWRTAPERRSSRAFAASALGTWRLSKWLLAQQAVNWIGASGHGWILTALLGPAAFGLYRAAYQVVNVLNPVRQAASNYLPSHAARTYASQGIDGLSQWYARSAWQLGVPFAALAAILALAAEPLAKLFYGQRLPLADLQFGLQGVVALGALAYALNFVRTPLDYAVLVSGGGRQLFLRSAALMAFVLTVGAAFIWRWGIVGTLLSEIATAALALWLTLRVFRLGKAPTPADDSLLPALPKGSQP